MSCGSAKLDPWAEAKDLEYFSTQETFVYWCCQDCQSLSISPIPAHRLEEIYPSNYYAYEQNSSSPLQAVKQWLDRRRLKRLLDEIPGEKIRVLDVGGGTGWMLEVLKKTDPRVQETTVVDTHRGAVEIAISQGHHGYCGILESYETAKKFDLILLLNLIEHVENPTALLAKTKTLLAEKGRVLLKTPNVDCWEGRVLRHQNWGAYHCPRHWVLFNSASLTQLLDQSRLQVVSLTHTQGATFWASTTLMTLHKKGWIGLGENRPVHLHPLYSLLCAFFAGVDTVRSLFTKTSQMFVVASHQTKAGA